MNSPPSTAKSYQGATTTSLNPPNAAGKGHQHSKSASGATTGLGLPHSTSAQQLSSSANLTGDAAKFRASLDGPRSVSGSAALGLGRAPGRPASEMLAMGHAPVNPETEAIDRWFEDLQHYEATLEEMAAASLDQNFKEELTAIEQWFNVLSAAERTAALYSLLQSCTPVQIRFFITVLQQLARNDPDNPLLSPTGPASASMQDQMESKLAAMGYKGPTSPAMAKFGRQSLGPTTMSAAADYLSPKSARLDDNAAATLAQQRAKLKAQAHRISAPGTLSASSDLKSPLWAQNETVAERRSPSPSGQRPKSTGSDVSGLSQSGNNQANPMMRSPFLSLEDQLSPMLGGNWSSMVNTPLVPMFADQANNLANNNGAAANNEPQSPGVDLPGANHKLAGWSQQQQSNIVLDDAKKFRRSGRMPDMSPQMAFSPRSSTNRRNVSGSSSALGSSQTDSQRAALSAQANWRNVNGLLTPNTAGGASNSSMSPQDMANALLQQQQMMQAQLQLQQNLMMNGMMMNGLMSPNLNLMNMSGGLSPALSSAGGNKRSPRPGGSFGQRTPQLVQGSGANPEEEVDDALLNDVSAWLRSLRLHKYTPNFETSTWREMVALDDAGLEAKGVSALGARRKLLKVFENVRIAKGMQTERSASPALGSTPDPNKEDGHDE